MTPRPALPAVLATLGASSVAWWSATDPCEFRWTDDGFTASVLCQYCGGTGERPRYVECGKCYEGRRRDAPYRWRTTPATRTPVGRHDDGSVRYVECEAHTITPAEALEMLRDAALWPWEIGDESAPPETLPFTASSRTQNGHEHHPHNARRFPYTRTHGWQDRPRARRTSGDPHEARGEGARRASRSPRRRGHLAVRPPRRDPRSACADRPPFQVEIDRTNWQRSHIGRTMYGMTARIDLTGRVFGRLRVLRYHGTKEGTSRALWDCLCAPDLGGCGALVVKQGVQMRLGKCVSCGCWGDFMIRAGLIRRHGGSAKPKQDHRATGYYTWSGMKRRCFRVRDAAYPDYGGRGITMCARWRESFEAFREDMGPRPSAEHSIDRIDNDGSYTCGRHDLCDDCRTKKAPANCRWTTQAVQNRNTRSNRIIEFRGERRCINEWAEITGIGESTIRFRLRKGWSPAQALTVPVLTASPRGIRKPRPRRSKADIAQRAEARRERLALIQNAAAEIP